MNIMMKAELPNASDDIAPLLAQLQAPRKPGALIIAEAECAAARKLRASVAGEQADAIAEAQRQNAARATDEMIRATADLELADQRVGICKQAVLKHRPALQEKLAAVMTSAADEITEAVGSRLEGLDQIAGALRELNNFAIANGISGPKQIGKADRISALLRDLRAAFLV